MTIDLTDDEAATILKVLYANRRFFVPEYNPAVENLIGQLGGTPLATEPYYLVTVTMPDGTTLYPTGTGTMFQCDSKARLFDDPDEAERFAAEFGESAGVIERVGVKRENSGVLDWSLDNI